MLTASTKANILYLAGGMVMAANLYFLFLSQKNASKHNQRELQAKYTGKISSAEQALALIQEGRISAGIKELNLGNLGLTELPDISNLVDLELLNLSGNRLSSLPPYLRQMRKLKILFMSGNNFRSVPPVVRHLDSLFMLSLKSNGLESIEEDSLPHTVGWLILTQNKLKSLPRSIGKHRALQKLMLAHNQLSALPAELSRCKKLELVRLSNNKLSDLPALLKIMAQLPRLSWIALADNAGLGLEEASLLRSSLESAQVDVKAAVKRNNVLGKGASGTVYRAEAQGRAVAVKVFSAVGSDGTPAAEVRATWQVGRHPNIIVCLGVQQAEGQQAIVMELVDQAFGDLGNPPNFHTVTRDTYPPRTTFEGGVALRVLGGVAAALQHMHEQGVCHGDLYAHNILVGPGGQVKMGDFGASFLYPARLRGVFEALDVRGFGMLVEDLASRLKDIEAGNSGNVSLQAQLAALSFACRPTASSASGLTFEEIGQRLASMQ